MPRTLLGSTRGLAIEPTSIAALEACPNIQDILAAYAAESAIAGLPPPVAKVEMYRALEASGILTVFAARYDDELIGYITVLINALPHYSINVATCESFFVLKEHRKTGAGLRLLKAAEKKAREVDAPGLLISAPFEGDLFKVLPRVGYRETNRVYFKSFMAAPARIALMSQDAIAKVRAFEDASLATQPQDRIGTEHLIHGGLYARTITLQPDCHLTGALIKLATVLIVSGDADVYVGGPALELRGYNVVAASAGRKQLIIARSVVHLTMMFATDAETVEQAERAFTDEHERLFTRLPDAVNRTTITGE